MKVSLLISRYFFSLWWDFLLLWIGSLHKEEFAYWFLWTIFKRIIHKHKNTWGTAIFCCFHAINFFHTINRNRHFPKHSPWSDFPTNLIIQFGRTIFISSFNRVYYFAQLNLTRIPYYKFAPNRVYPKFPYFITDSPTDHQNYKAFPE